MSDVSTAAPAKPAKVVVSSIVVVGPPDKGRSAAHKLIRKTLRQSGVVLGNQLLAGQYEGDHLLVTHDIPAGKYMFAMNRSPEGHVQLDFSEGVVTAADAAAAEQGIIDSVDEP